MTELEQTRFFFDYLFNEGQIDNLNIIEEDPPDFEFTYAGELISLEHTRYFKPGGEKIKAKKILQKKIIEKSYKYYSVQNKPPITVGFVFEHNITLRQNELDDYCKEISRFIISKVPKEFNDNGAIQIKNNLPRYLKRLSIVKYSFEYSYWQPFGAYKVDEIDYDKLNNLINKKSSDIDRYNNSTYFDHWLLIVIERQEYSNYSEFKNEKFKNEIMSKNKFNRIYLAAMRHRPSVIRIK